jgi:hypothetical protein
MASNGNSASHWGSTSSSEISGGDQAIDSGFQAPYDLVYFRRQPHVRESFNARTADLQLVEELACELHSRPPRIGNRRKLFPAFSGLAPGLSREAPAPPRRSQITLRDGPSASTHSVASVAQLAQRMSDDCYAAVAAGRRREP